jgi:predicted nucleotidyltransferase
MVTAVTTRDDLIAQIELIRSQLCASGVRRLALFGSFARNTQRNDSDVDLLVDFLPGRKTFDAFMAVYDLLEKTLQRRIELITPESLSPHIGPRILQEAKDVLLAD